jgi:hypothetical protein
LTETTRPKTLNQLSTTLQKGATSLRNREKRLSNQVGLGYPVTIDTSLRKSKPSEPGRLLNPLELINLVKIAFPGSVAVLDEAGHFVIIGIERRKGVVSHLIPGQDYDECRKLNPSETKGKYKVPPPTAIRDMFPFGILDGMVNLLIACSLLSDMIRFTVNPSSSAHSFASVIKNKLRFLNSHDGAQLEREGPTGRS